MVERSAVNRLVVGSNPTSGATARLKLCSARLISRGPFFRHNDCFKTGALNAKGFLIIACVAAALWWYRSNDSVENAPAPTHRHSVADRSSNKPVASVARQQPAAAAPDQQRRNAAVSETVRLANEREAAREKAIADYNRRRHELDQKLEALEHSNLHGSNNAAIEELIRERSALMLPQ